MTPKSRRGRGEGALFQLHTPDCPPPGPDGARPEHTCRGMWRGIAVDRNHKRIYVHAKTKRAALVKLNEVKAHLAEHGAMRRGRYTVEQWLVYWLSDIAGRRVKPTTLATYRTQVHEYLIPHLGGLRLDELSRHHVRQLHRDLEATPARRGGDTLSFGTIRTTHGVLSAALDDAVKDDVLAVNVAKGIGPRGHSRQRGHLTTAQARAVLAATADDRLGSRWLFTLLSGCRQGERLGLRWSHVDLDDAVADISWQLQEVPWSHGCGDNNGHRPASCPDRRLDIPLGWEHVRVHGAQVLMRPKGGKRKVIPLVPFVVAALRRRHEAYLGERDGYEVDHDLVWCHDDGRPIARRQDYQDWRNTLAAAGLPHVELHGLRHTTASLLDELGVHEGIVQQVLGHSRVTTTRGYTHRDLTQARAALVRLGQVLELSGEGP